MANCEKPYPGGCVPEALKPERFRHRAMQQLAAIVESSEDAILTKDLDGFITTWNFGAERLFGYTPEEAIGEPITMIIPEDRHDEETDILARLRRGERIEHYETVRQRREGGLVDVSLTVSPLKDENGTIIGASSIARDITERRRAFERQQLLLREMEHRIKNVFSLAGSLVALSARSAETPTELAETVQQRLGALARAHSMTLPSRGEASEDGTRAMTLHGLLHTILSPFLGGDETKRLRVSGEDLMLAPSAVTPLALALNELATNAAKHGALASPTGRISFDSRDEGDHVALSWTEHLEVSASPPTEHEGFGSQLTRMTLERQLGGTISREWQPNGLAVTVVIDREKIEANGSDTR